MPVSREFRGRVLIVRTTGPYTNEELERAFRDAPREPEFRPGTPVLVDGRLSEAALTPSDTRWRIGLLEELPALGFARHFALMIRRGDPLRFGLARQLSLSVEASGIELRVFDDEQAAIEWLASRSPSAG